MAEESGPDRVRRALDEYRGLRAPQQPLVVCAPPDDGISWVTVPQLAGGPYALSAEQHEFFHAEGAAHTHVRPPSEQRRDRA